MFIAAAHTERGHARFLALDCPPESGGVVRPGRLIVEADLPPGEYVGERVWSDSKREPVKVILPDGMPEGLHRNAFFEVQHG